MVSMRFKRKHINLGNYRSEIECAKIYNQQALFYNNHYETNYKLNEIPDYITVEKNIYEKLKYTRIDNKSSKYTGVIKLKNETFNSQIVLNKKHIRLGNFKNEIDAAKSL